MTSDQTEINKMDYEQEFVMKMLSSAGNPSEMFDYVVIEGQDLKPSENTLAHTPIERCLSKSAFDAVIGKDGIVHIYGNSESTVLRGVIQIMKRCFDGMHLFNIKRAGIYWQYESHLYDYLTPQRQDAVSQMEKRIMNPTEQQ